MTDSVAEAARSAAAILAPDLGRNLPAEVEAALAARGGDQRPDRFFSTASLGSLIVSVASLARTVHIDLRNHTRDREPEADALTRQLRIKLAEQDTAFPPGTERITEVVAAEIGRQAN